MPKCSILQLGGCELCLGLLQQAPCCATAAGAVLVHCVFMLTARHVTCANHCLGTPDVLRPGCLAVTTVTAVVGVACTVADCNLQLHSLDTGVWELATQCCSSVCWVPRASR